MLLTAQIVLTGQWPEALEEHLVSHTQILPSRQLDTNIPVINQQHVEAGHVTVTCDRGMYYSLGSSFLECTDFTLPV